MAENAEVGMASGAVSQGPEGHQTPSSKRTSKADRRGARRQEDGSTQGQEGYKKVGGPIPSSTYLDQNNYSSPEPRLFSLKLAAAYLGGVSRDVVRGLINSGAVPGISLGRRLLVAREDLDSWIQRAKGQERPRQPGKDWKRRAS